MVSTKEDLLRGLSQIYEDSQLTLLRLVATRLARGTSSPDWAMDKLLELGYLQQDARREVAKSSQRAVQQIIGIIQASYSGGQADALEEAVRLGLKDRTMQAGRGIVSEAQRVLVESSLSFVNRSNARVLRSVDDVYRRIITEASGQELTGAMTRAQVVQRSLDRFADQGVTAFVDKRGRQWEMQAYADMAVRTVTHHASTQGHLDSLAARGRDLVIVSDHKGECPSCRPWEGMVLSISGEDPERQSVEQARSGGLEHPGCRHRYGIYIPGVTRPMEPQGKPEDYEHIQRQRAMERGIRQAKRRAAVATTPEAKAKADALVKARQKQLREHVAEHGLKRRNDREQVLAGRKGVAPTRSEQVQGMARTEVNTAVRKVAPGLRLDDEFELWSTNTPRVDERAQKRLWQEWTGSNDDERNALKQFTAGHGSRYAGQTKGSKTSGLDADEYMDQILSKLPQVKEKVYRGAAVSDDVLKRLKAGSGGKLDEDLWLSWSTDPKVANTFSALRAQQTGKTPILFELEGGGSHVAAPFASGENMRQLETVTKMKDQFEVIGHRVREDGVVVFRVRKKR